MAVRLFALCVIDFSLLLCMGLAVRQTIIHITVFEVEKAALGQSTLCHVAIIFRVRKSPYVEVQYREQRVMHYPDWGIQSMPTVKESSRVESSRVSGPKISSSPDPLHHHCHSLALPRSYPFIHSPPTSIPLHQSLLNPHPSLSLPPSLPLSSQAPPSLLAYSCSILSSYNFSAASSADPLLPCPFPAPTPPIAFPSVTPILLF